MQNVTIDLAACVGMVEASCERCGARLVIRNCSTPEDAELAINGFILGHNPCDRIPALIPGELP